MAERTYQLSELEEEKSYLLRLFKLHDIGREVCIPAIVEDYDRSTHVAKVRPLVNHLQYEKGELSPIARSSVYAYVFQSAHGGFILDAPLFKGDTGLLIAGDRDCTTAIDRNSTFLYKGQEGDVKDGEGNVGAKNPDSYEVGKFVHGFFIPFSFAQTDLEDDMGLVIHHAKDADGKDGAERGIRRIIISDDGMRMTVQKESGGDEGVEISLKEDEVRVMRSGEETSDAVMMTDKGLLFEGEIDREQDEVTDVRYNRETNRIQKKSVKKSIRGDFVVGVGEETDWEDTGDVIQSGVALGDAETGGISTISKIDRDEETGESMIYPAGLVAGDNVSLKEEKNVDGRTTITFSSTGGGAEYVKGADTNIVFTDKGNNRIAIDVYYN